MGLKTTVAASVKPAKQIVAEVHDQYGLGIGPEGTRHTYTGFQAKAQKWSHLFATDPDGDSVLMNVVRYLEANSNDYLDIEAGVEKFIEQYQQYKASRYGTAA